ncbi:MAG: hypothetical protein J0J01_28835 [Reyranella sp.]|uniref:hypothetical protein n=1 Tax=Reyranella sp. TaxID=1929291 RepID=UPI001AD349DB|nr:hypothetical protein [Reyranella sp.]MBN9090940.1 hypothetical protein [Reyranella sp.]
MAATLSKIAREARRCRRCPLYRNATQTAFGEGPAGKILDRALAEADIDRDAVYVVNVVEHFKNGPRGKRRLHKKPNRSEIEVLQGLVRPGTGAGPASDGPGDGRHGGLGVGRQGRHPVAHERQADGIRRWPAENGDHPSLGNSAILRAPDEAGRRRAYAGLVKDLKSLAKAASERG